MTSYKTNQELPTKIQDHLSEAAQDFYRIAFNSAVQWYGDDDKAHHAAWSAIRSQRASLNSSIN